MAGRRGLLWQSYAVSVAFGGFLGLSGAFQTDEVPALVRYAYWIGLMLAGTALGDLAARFALPLARITHNPLAVWIAETLIVGLPMILIVWLVTGLVFWGGLAPDRIVSFAGPVMMISAIMGGIITLLNSVPSETHAAMPGQPGEPVQPPAFLRRLPPRLHGAELHAVEADDHYLKVHTSRGREMVLMRLSDAIGELEGIEGARVHRSWWVARGAVVASRRLDGRAELDLQGGLTVPVSRSFVRALAGEGWFDPPGG